MNEESRFTAIESRLDKLESPTSSPSTFGDLRDMLDMCNKRVVSAGGSVKLYESDMTEPARGFDRRQLKLNLQTAQTLYRKWARWEDALKNALEILDGNNNKTGEFDGHP